LRLLLASFATMLAAGCTTGRLINLQSVHEPELVVAHVVAGPKLLSSAPVNVGIMAAIYEVRVRVDEVLRGPNAIREGDEFVTRLMAGNGGSLQEGAEFLVLVDPKIVNGGGFGLLYWRPLEHFACVGKAEITSSGLDVGSFPSWEKGDDVCLR
jgi:hypothetical protein